MSGIGGKWSHIGVLGKMESERGIYIVLGEGGVI